MSDEYLPEHNIRFDFSVYSAHENPIRRETQGNPLRSVQLQLLLNASIPYAHHVKLPHAVCANLAANASPRPQIRRRGAPFSPHEPGNHLAIAIGVRVYARARMDPDAEIAFEFVPVIRQYKSGRVERLAPLSPVPPSLDAASGVISRDATIDAATGLWARLYLPDLSACPGGRRLPVVIYFHGGGLVVGSAADAPEHAFLNRLAARAGALAVSVEYRLAPEHPVPACYDDAWAALRWAAAGPASADPWVRDHGGEALVFVLGFSAGGNVAHNVTLRAGLEEGDGARVKGMALLHPYFLSANKTEGEVRVPWLHAKLEEMWTFACGGRTTGPDDPRANPVADGAPSLRRLGCDRVLVCTAADELEVRGKAYYKGLLASGWAQGDAELLDSAGEEHEFHLKHPDSAKALILMERLVALINGNP